MTEIGIYTIYCGNSYYIGKSKDVRSRWKFHLHLLGRNRHHCKKLQAAWNENLRNFSFKVISHLTVKDDLDSYEQEWVRYLLSSGYQVYNNGLIYKPKTNVCLDVSTLLDPHQIQEQQALLEF
jgi:hypothetical protein